MSSKLIVAIQSSIFVFCVRRQRDSPANYFRCSLLSTNVNLFTFSVFNCLRVSVGRNTHSNLDKTARRCWRVGWTNGQWKQNARRERWKEMAKPMTHRYFTFLDGFTSGTMKKNRPAGDETNDWPLDFLFSFVFFFGQFSCQLLSDCVRSSCCPVAGDAAYQWMPFRYIIAVCICVYISLYRYVYWIMSFCALPRSAANILYSYVCDHVYLFYYHFGSHNITHIVYPIQHLYYYTISHDGRNECTFIFLLFVWWFGLLSGRNDGNHKEGEEKRWQWSDRPTEILAGTHSITH